ncbi:MAG: TonB-dependent receptor [Mariniphaga sp.]|nr:TonB-dependent receptor [Mariniphaga sp.]
MKRITFIAIVLFVINQPGYTQNEKPDTLKNYKLDEIIIQSPKYNRNILEIPASASMVPERMIEFNRIENLTDISSVIPNFFMPDYGSKLTSPVYIRGVGNRINTPSVGLYVDEIPYFEKAAFNFDFFDVERIEVLRGPQGTLYGRNAMGGLIHIITNKPQQKQFTTVFADYGNFNQIRSGITHNQPIGKSLSIQGSLNQRHNDGFYTNSFSQTEVDKINSYSGRLKALYSSSEIFNASASLQYEDSRQGGYPYALFDDEKMEAGEINYDKESLYNRKLFSTGLSLNYTAPLFLLRMMYSLQSLKDYQEIDQDFTPESLFFVEQDQNFLVFTQEWNVESNKKGAYQWLFGTFGFSQGLTKTVTVEYGEDGLAKYHVPHPSFHYTKDYYNTNSGIAFFHQSTLNLGSFFFSAGIRADYEKATLEYEYDNFPGSAQVRVESAMSELKFFEILPKVAVQYTISDHIIPCITVAKGYNSGGFNATFEREEDRSFDPEHSWNYEAGLKAKWLRQRIYANLAFFYIDWTKQQIYQTVPSGTGSMLTNAGKSESKGVELELKVLPAENLETWITMGYNDAKFVEYIKSENENYSGNYLPYVPRFSFNTGGNYELKVKADFLDKIRFHLTYNGFGKHYWHETNEAWQDYYGLLNHRVCFEKNNIVLSFWGKNILNTGYNSFYFQALGNSYAQIGKPATLGLHLKVTF